MRPHPLLVAANLLMLAVIVFQTTNPVLGVVIMAGAIYLFKVYEDWYKNG